MTKRTLFRSLAAGLISIPAQRLFGEFPVIPNYTMADVPERADQLPGAVIKVISEGKNLKPCVATWCVTEVDLSGVDQELLRLFNEKQKPKMEALRKSIEVICKRGGITVGEYERRRVVFFNRLIKQRTENQER